MSTKIVSRARLAGATADQLAAHYTACLAESAEAMGGSAKRARLDAQAVTCREALAGRGYRLVRSVMDESVFYAERVPAAPGIDPADPVEGLS